MAKFTAPPAIRKQWRTAEKKEQRFLEKQYESGMSAINDKIESKIPEKLRSALDTGFNKAFYLIFEKGTDIIEKTYDREKHETEYKTNEYAEAISPGRRTSAAFSKKAGSTKRKNLLISGVEGIGLGILGVGLPDIPLFTSVILKSIYEIALSYGYSYDTEEEQLFILKLINAAMSHGEELYVNDREINQWIYGGKKFSADKDEQIRITSDSLAMELIYSKFIQTIPIAGAIGGAYDVIYLRKITQYADIKYQKRFLFGKMQPKGE